MIAPTTKITPEVTRLKFEYFRDLASIERASDMELLLGMITIILGSLLRKR